MPDQPNPVVLSWDWREQPDLEKLAEAVRKVYGGYLYEIETHLDDYAIVLSTTPLDAAELAELWAGGE